MKGKIVSYESLVNQFQSKTNMSYGSIPPTVVISGQSLFYSWMGSISVESVPNIALGTIFRWRLDPKDYPDFLNQDQWLVLSTGTLSLVRIAEVGKRKIPYHHANKLPEAWESPPSWVNDLIITAGTAAVTNP